MNRNASGADFFYRVLCGFAYPSIRTNYPLWEGINGFSFQESGLISQLLAPIFLIYSKHLLLAHIFLEVMESECVIFPSKASDPVHHTGDFPFFFKF